jgi:triosephosphate isomerase
MISQHTMSSKASPLPTPLPALLVGTSTKAYFTHARTTEYLKSALQLTNPAPDQVAVFFIPSFLSIPASAELLSKSTSSGPGTIYLGAQDCHFTPSIGPSTGSIPPEQLTEFGCSLVELGHAERRRPPLGESDDLVVSKVNAAVSQGLVPLVCIGERTRAASTSSVEDAIEVAMHEVGPQVDGVLGAVGEAGRVVFAYEPVWAIGAKEPAPAEHVKGVVKKIKEATQGRLAEVRVLYGGSAGPGTWQGLKGVVDGLFLGRFAHDVQNFQRVIDEVGGHA